VNERSVVVTGGYACESPPVSTGKKPVEIATERYRQLVDYLGSTKRFRHGWASEVGRSLGVTASYVRAIHSGNDFRIGPAALAKAVRNLGISREWFFAENAVSIDEEMRLAHDRLSAAGVVAGKIEVSLQGDAEAMTAADPETAPGGLAAIAFSPRLIQEEWAGLLELSTELERAVQQRDRAKAEDLLMELATRIITQDLFDVALRARAALLGPHRMPTDDVVPPSKIGADLELLASILERFSERGSLAEVVAKKRPPATYVGWGMMLAQLARAHAAAMNLRGSRVRRPHAQARDREREETHQLELDVDQLEHWLRNQLRSE
jgi:transcriptional regulator with XRE-family HTH domain